MGKLLILVVVVVVVAWMVMSRRRPADREKPKAERPEAPRRNAPGAPTPMLACAHCGVHLPQADAVVDGEGRAYCTEAHRLAGPR